MWNSYYYHRSDIPFRCMNDTNDGCYDKMSTIMWNTVVFGVHVHDGLNVAEIGIFRSVWRRWRRIWFLFYFGRWCHTLIIIFLATAACLHGSSNSNRSLSSTNELIIFHLNMVSADDDGWWWVSLRLQIVRHSHDSDVFLPFIWPQKQNLCKILPALLLPLITVSGFNVLCNANKEIKIIIMVFAIVAKCILNFKKTQRNEEN